MAVTCICSGLSQAFKSWPPPSLHENSHGDCTRCQEPAGGSETIQRQRTQRLGSLRNSLTCTLDTGLHCLLTLEDADLCSGLGSVGLCIWSGHFGEPYRNINRTVDVESHMRLDVAWLHAGTRHLTREFGREVEVPSCHAYSVWWGQRPALPSVCFIVAFGATRQP